MRSYGNGHKKGQWRGRRKEWKWVWKQVSPMNCTLILTGKTTFQPFAQPCAPVHRHTSTATDGESLQSLQIVKIILAARSWSNNLAAHSCKKWYICNPPFFSFFFGFPWKDDCVTQPKHLRIWWFFINLFKLFFQSSYVISSINHPNPSQTLPRPAHQTIKQLTGLAKYEYSYSLPSTYYFKSIVT